jgi:uncharacterized DUF497 family protein
MPNGPLKFEWDPKKATTNLRKHGVSFEEGTSVFNDLLATVTKILTTQYAKSDI